MNPELITEYPAWFFLLCLAAGLAGAALLYYRERQLAEVPVWKKRVMAFLRGISIAILTFFLLNPLIKTLTRKVEKPIIVLAEDNSSSLLQGNDSGFIRKEYPLMLDQLADDLSGDYEVRRYSFGEQVGNRVDYSFSDRQTNMSALFDELYNRFYNRNIGAIVVAGDGLYNQGSNPVYAASKMKFPVYTVALGDTNIRKDLVIAGVNFNRTAYLGNNFPLQVLISARKCKNETAELTVSENDQVLYRKQIPVTGNTYSTTVPVLLEAKEKGIHRYRVQVQDLAGEANYINNARDVFIEVLENKQRVLIVAAAPHPDAAALKTAIGGNLNFEASVVMADKFDGQTGGYNLVILHQLPVSRHPAKDIVKRASATGTSLWFILGAQTAVPAFNSLETGLTIQDTRGKTNDIYPVLSGDFSLFEISDELRGLAPQLPPLIGPFGTYKSNAGLYNFMYQRIGALSTRQPLLFFSHTGHLKIGVLTGEGIWRWRLHDFMRNGSHKLSDEAILKVVQYLSVRENRSRFRIITERDFPESKQVEFTAEFYNESYELINTPDISLQITNSEGKAFPFTFSKSGKAYALNAGYFPVGNYRYKATVKAGDKTFGESGQFSVSALQAESAEIVADHTLMNVLAMRQGGKMFYPSELKELAQTLRTSKDIKPVSYSENQLKELINLKWLFFLLLAFLTVEWFMRKYAGGY